MVNTYGQHVKFYDVPGSVGLSRGFAQLFQRDGCIKAALERTLGLPFAYLSPHSAFVNGIFGGSGTRFPLGIRNRFQIFFEFFPGFGADMSG